MLTKEEIESLQLVRNPIPAQFRAISYDLTVGDIYVPKEDGVVKKATSWWVQRRKGKSVTPGKGLVDEYEIPPNGIALIFSHEEVVLPSNICAFAEPKTSLCQDGLLVLNTGIVDPLYNGPLSGTIINFSDTPFLLKRGEPFLRLIFERVDNPTLPVVPVGPPIPRKVYMADKILHALRYPHTFLNMRRTVKEVAQTLMRKERNFVHWLIAILGMVMAVVTIVLTQWQAMPPFMKGTSEEIKKSLEESQKNAKELSTLLDEAKKNQTRDADRQQEQNKAVLEDQTKTIRALQDTNEKLRQRLDAIEKQLPPPAKDK